MKRLATLALAAIMLGTPAMAQVPVYPGTPAQISQALAEAPGDWADDAIELVVSRGIYIGYPDGTFDWRNDITRAEMAVVIARLISSYDLDSFDPSELMVLRQAVADLSDELAGLKALVMEHDEQLDEVADALDRHDDEIADLWDAIGMLDVAPEMFDATDLWAAIRALEDGMAANDAELADLNARMAALEDGSDLGDLLGRIAALEDQMANAAAERAALAALLDDLEARVAALEGQGDIIAQLQLRMDSAADRLALLEAQVADHENRLAALEAAVADHEERITALEETLNPDRAPFYISAALYGSAPDGGLVGQVTLGHDAVLGNMGLRASVDFGFGEVPMSISGLASYRATMNNVDGYAGIGLGASFEETGTAMFGELMLGISYRIARNFGVFVEGRYRPYFDGSGDGLAALGGGVQLRF